VLEWVISSTSGYNGLNIKDWTDGFQDGLAFCALIHKFNNDAIDFNSLSSENAEKNLKTAIDAGEKLNISTTLEIGNISDESEVFGFVSSLFKIFNPDSPLLQKRGNRTREEKKRWRR